MKEESLLTESIFFSLDPPKTLPEFGPLGFHPLQQQRFPEVLTPQSEIVKLMNHCDYLLKELATGVEVNPITFERRDVSKGVTTKLPAYLREILKPAKSHASGNRHRLWFEADDVLYEEIDQGEWKFHYLKAHPMRVRAHPLDVDVKGDLHDAVEESALDSPVTQFARGATLCMKNLYRYFPEICWLAEIIKMQWVARLFVMHFKASAERLEQARSDKPVGVAKLLDCYRAQIKEWPTDGKRSYQKHLDAICANNPSFSRHEVEAHFQSELNQCTTVARETDERRVQQLAAFLDDPAGSFDRSLLSGMVYRWLNSGDQSELVTLLSNQGVAPYERSHKVLCQEKVAIFKALGMSSPSVSIDVSLNPQCCVVPAVISQEGNSVVYGGVNLAANLSCGYARAPGQQPPERLRMANALSGGDTTGNGGNAGGGCSGAANGGGGGGGRRRGGKRGTLDGGGGNDGDGDGDGDNGSRRFGWVRRAMATTCLAASVLNASIYDTGFQYNQSAGYTAASYCTDVLQQSASAGVPMLIGANAARPLSFGEIRSSDESLANKFRTLGRYRNWAEAEKLYHKVPQGIRAEGATAIRKFLSKVHASHIQAHAEGGSSAAENIVFENPLDNLQRNRDYLAGRRDTPNMQPGELDAVNANNQKIGRGATLRQAGNAATWGAATGALTNTVVSGLENAVRVKHGEISGLECATETAKDIAKGAVVGGVGAAVAAGTIAAVPAIAPVVTTAGIGMAACAVIDDLCRAYTAANQLCDDHPQDGKTQASEDMLTSKHPAIAKKEDDSDDDR